MLDDFENMTGLYFQGLAEASGHSINPCGLPKLTPLALSPGAQRSADQHT